MAPSGQEWWTDERVEATVTKHFIYAHLRADEIEQLESPVFPELSDNTYLQCILLKARRLFLILIHLGLPGEIFRLIEDSYDDDNLPLDEDDVSTLKLPQNRIQQINVQFYRSQFKYLVRVIGEGEHIRYAENEKVPLQKVDQRMMASSSVLERAKLPSPVNRVFSLKRIQLLEERTEIDILSEIAAAKSLSHEHVMSVFGSYVQNGYMHVLIQPAAKYTLASFLNDRPKTFEALPKPERRSYFVIWPHCLANAVSWLHGRGSYHGAIRPSRILIDEQFQISLGQFEGDWTLGSLTPEGDLESYQYAAPELWRRSMSVKSQSFPAAPTIFGGRSAFGKRDAYRIMDEAQSRSTESSSLRRSKSLIKPAENRYIFVPKLKGVSSRLRLEATTDQTTSVDIPPRAEGWRHDRVDTPVDAPPRKQNLYRRYETDSIRSTSSSERNRRSMSSPSEQLYPIVPETKNAAVQTWKSAVSDLPAVDVFSLAATMMDMLTVLCSRSLSSFAKHRGARHRQAGRGGSMADCSFHANLTQVGTWAETIHKDAEKKLKKNNSTIFRAVGPILQVIMPCLDREPQKRMKASSLSRRLEQHLSEFAGIQRSHCTLDNAGSFLAKSQPTPTISITHEPSQVRDEVSEASISQSTERVPEKETEKIPISPVIRTKRDSKISGSLSGGYTPSVSNNTSATYCQSSIMSETYVDETLIDDFYDLSVDSKWPGSQYVQVMPRDRSTRRLHFDFTDDDDFGTVTPGTGPIPRAAANLRRENARNNGTPELPISAKSNHSSLPMYPPASPPPTRELPASPGGSTRSRPHRKRRPRTPPPANVYHTNDRLAVALDDLVVDERTGLVSMRSAPEHRPPSSDDEEWVLTR